MNTHDIELPSSDEAAAHMLPSDLKKFESGEHVAEAFSIAVGNPDETSQPLFTLDQVRAAIEADRKRRGEPVAWPTHEFAIVVDRMYEGEGPSLAMWNGENYQFSDGDCYDRETDGSLDGYTAEWLTHHQLEQRLFAPQPAEPVKVPSIDEIMDAVWAYGCAHGMRKVTATELVTRWRDIRALLTRYGNAAQPAQGQEVSIDISTGDHDAGRRAFGKLTGEVNAGVWLAEGYVNQPTASAEPFGHVWRASDTTAVIKLVGDPRIIDGMPVYAAPVAEQLADGEEIIVSLPDGRRYPLPLLPTGMGAPRYRVEVPAPQPAGAAHE